MPDIEVLVLADPAAPQLRLVHPAPRGVRITIGTDPDVIEPAAASADVILTWFSRPKLLERVWPLAARVRWVHSMAAGLDSFLFPALVESPVVLTNSRGVFSQSLGEFVVAAVLFFAKDFRRMLRSQERGAWEQFDVDEVRGKTLGIVGYGDIGRAVARRARGLDMRVLALRRRPERSEGDPWVEEVVPPERKLDLVARSDYLVVAAPLTPETRRMIGEAEIAALGPSAVVINIGRGPVVDEAALIRALEAKRIRGAALDVYEVEPLPSGHPFYRLENVLLSTHCADHTASWTYEAVQCFVDNLERFLKGEPLANVVEKRLGY